MVLSARSDAGGSSVSGGEEVAKIRVRRAYYDLVSCVYDRLIALHSGDAAAAARDLLVERAGVDAGSRVLDLCTGTGAVALRAQQATGPRGLVVGLDLSGGMIRKAQQNASVMHLESIAFVVGDAARLPFATASFDAVSCSHAVTSSMAAFGTSSCGKPAGCFETAADS